MRMDNQFPPRKVPSFCSFRYGLSLLLHFCNVIITAQRTCLSLTMVAMVNSTDAHGLANTTTEEHLDHNKNPVYNWNPQVQGFIFSSIFYGALITQIPAGYLSEKYSIKKMIGFAFLLSSLLSLLMPMAAEGGEAFLLACRVAQGAAQGSISIAQHVVWVKWAPPLERGRLTSLSLSGILLGSFVVLLVTGFICQSLGWPMAFYIFGACGCALSLLWFVLFYDDPKDHPCISISEKEYILSSLSQQVSSRTQSLPIKAMIKSLPVWAIALGSFAFHWTNNIMVFYTPTFINSKLRVNIKENGMLSALPSLFAWSFGILAGHLTDFFLSKNILRLVTIRKLFNTLGLLLPPFFSMCLLYWSFSFSSITVFLILASSTGAFCMAGVLINGLDIAPSYYGFLKGITTLIGMIGGLTSSTLCGVILNQDPESAWFKIFFLMAVINGICLLFCLVFGKAEIQDWAKDRQEHTRL
ncbi:sodium-dependent phosphate transport protein 1 [Neovison vison]|uniref:Solute carrier family 17 member 1 n=3 Tax=Neovison vison TaxID=452646 RepID=A0A8C7ANY7_NEOVI|nr:sodium-dependent phosphate transport protein 1 [Neogale vison]XP_044116124.1 sodium-dependent phosphate transport protein 1 [Neogale vison]XP_044116128.1 sodium-dependent phosphate transport protein 1 [Neogale vison]